MNVTIQIDRLILEGISLTPAQTPLLQAAVEAELAHLVAVGGLSSELLTGGAAPLLRAGNIQLISESAPAQLGQQIAQAVYSSIGQV